MSPITGRLDLTAWRNDDWYEYPLRVRGVDLRGTALAMQIRKTGDASGLPLVSLSNVTDVVEGLRFVDTVVEDGIEVSELRIRMDRKTLQDLPYYGEFGESADFDYAFLIGGRTRLVGKFILPAHAYGSDNAPDDRPESFGLNAGSIVPDGGATLTIDKDGGASVSIDGADLVSKAIGRSESARDEAITAAKDTVAALDSLGQDAFNYVGRPADAVLVTGTPKGVGSVFWHDAVDVAGNLTSVDVFDRAAGVVNVAVYRGPLNALARVGLGSFATTGTGTSRRIALAAPLAVRAGDILAIQPADGALTVAELQSGDAGYTYSSPFLPENVSLGAPTTNGQVQVRFVITYREQIVTADNFLALSEIRVIGARARALSSAANPAGYVAWTTTGAPTGHTVTWDSYTAKLGPLADRMEFPQWSVSKPLFVVGNSLSDSTEVLNRWSQLLAARYGQHLVSVARASSDQRMISRSGAAAISLTLAGALPAGGSVAVSQINGAPIDGNNVAAFLTTGDPAVVNGMSMTGYVSRNGVERKVTVSAPNGASYAYSVTQAPGQTAITFDGPVLFTPEASLSIHGSTCIVWMGNNFFYSEVPNQYGDYTNPQMWVDLKLIVSFLQSQGCQVLLLPVIPASLPEWVEGVGTPLTASRAANARTEQLFPGLMARHADGRDLIKFLQDRKDGSADAQADVNKGWIPRNLHRAGDALHLNADGDVAVADFVDSALRSQVGPPAITQATTFTVIAQGAQAGPDATASVRVVRDQLASLADAVDGVVQDAVYRPTIAAAIADFEVGTFFVSRDLDGLTAHTGVKWQYKVTAAAPHFSDEGPWSDTNAVALGLDAYVGTTPARLPVSTEQAGAIAQAKADALASTSALGLMTGFALDRRIRTDAVQALSDGEKSQARTNLGAIDQATLDATANSIVIGSWADFATRTVLPSIAVVTSAAFDVLGYRGGARYVLDADQSDGVPTAYRKRSANGRWFVLDEQSPTMAQLGVIGTDTETPNVTPDETVTIEAALAFCAARKLTLRMPGRHYWAKTIQLRSDLKIVGNDAWFRCIKSAAPEFVSIQAGRNRYMSIVGIGFAGANDPGQIGLHFDARKSDTSADGGLWDSTIIAKVRNFAGHSVWLRGGNKRYMAGGAAYDYSTPIQFNTFSLDVERPAGNDTGCSLVMTGQYGQNYFVGQNRFDSRKTGEANVAGAVKGLNVYIGREITAGALPGVPYDPASGATLGAFSGAVVDDLAPDTITMLGTIQQAERGIWVDRATVVMLEGSYIEDLQRAVKLTATGSFSIDDSKFGNAGSDGNGGGYLVEYGAGCSLSGKGNYCIGYRDKLIVRPGATIGRNIDAEKFFTNFTSDPSGLTTGLTLDTSVTAAGEIVAAGYRSVLVYGSTVEITKITTYTLAGAIHTFRCHSGYLIFGTGTNFVVPNGRVVLRPGDSISFRVLDIGARLQCMGVARSELRAATIPTTGYYEAGEFVRSTVAPKAYGAFTTGWRRLTTGSAHVVDVDWRVEIQRERFQRTVSVGTSAAAIMSVQKGNVNYGSDRIDITVVGVDDSNGGRQFTDRIVVFGTAAQVIASDTINIAAASVAPAARTYAITGTDLTLAMASGAYSVRAVSQATPTGHLNLSNI